MAEPDRNTDGGFSAAATACASRAVVVVRLSRIRGLLGFAPASVGYRFTSEVHDRVDAVERVFGEFARGGVPEDSLGVAAGVGPQQTDRCVARGSQPLDQ